MQSMVRNVSITDMITLADAENGYQIHCRTRRVAVYLDNFAFVEFASTGPRGAPHSNQAIRAKVDQVWSIINSGH